MMAASFSGRVSTILVTLLLFTPPSTSEIPSQHRHRTENNTDPQAPLHVFRDGAGALRETPEEPAPAAGGLAAIASELLSELDSLYLDSMPVRIRVSPKAVSDAQASGPVHVFRDSSGKLVEEPVSSAQAESDSAHDLDALLDSLYLDSTPIRSRSASPRPSGGKDSKNQGFVHVYRNAEGILVEEPEDEPPTLFDPEFADQLDALYEDSIPVRVQWSSGNPHPAQPVNTLVGDDGSLVVAEEEDEWADASALDELDLEEELYFDDAPVKHRSSRVQHDVRLQDTVSGPLHVFRDQTGKLVAEPEVDINSTLSLTFDMEELDSLYFDSVPVRIRSHNSRLASGTTSDTVDQHQSQVDVTSDLDTLYLSDVAQDRRTKGIEVSNVDNQGPIHVYRDETGALIEEPEITPSKARSNFAEVASQLNSEALHMGVIPVRTCKAIRKVPKVAPAGMQASRGIRAVGPRLRSRLRIPRPSPQLRNAALSSFKKAS